MKKRTFCSANLHLFGIAFLLLSVNASALDYSISFSGFGTSTNVDSVKVQNLTKGTSVTVPTTYVLHLSDAPNAVDKVNADMESVGIYPNPIQTSSTLTFNSMKAGNTQIMAYSMDGRKLLEYSGTLNEGRNSFQLSLPAGIYSIQINGNGFRYNAKALSQSLICSSPQISFNGQSLTPSIQKAKATPAINLFYNTGDQLLFKGYSGKNTTVVTDKPTISKTISFEFVECKDADNNNYGVVRIGAQIWMTENLKTTKYNDGTAIPTATDSTTWVNNVSGSYCWYNFDISNKYFGALYNWWSVGTSKLAPNGWHVASDQEWTEMENYLINNGYNFDGTTSGNKNAKSLASTTLWQGNTRSDTIFGAIANNLAANNSSGFSSVPSGCFYGNFNDPRYTNGGYVTNWWTASAANNEMAWSRDMYYDYNSTSRYYDSKIWGKSVRCVCYTGNTPHLITNDPSSITSTSVVCGGNIVFGGNFSVFERGVCWSTSHNPTTALSTKMFGGYGTGNFVSTITGLTKSTTYYVRAYVTDGTTTIYGLEQQFATQINDYAGQYLCVGYRIRPGNATEPVAYGTIEQFSGEDATTCIKQGFGNYTAYYVRIQVTTNTMVVGGVTCFKVNAIPVNASGAVVGGMYTTWTGDPLTLPAPPANLTEINYYNPVTRTFVLNCFYTSAANRIMYEILTRQ